MTERLTSITMQAFRGIAESFTVDLKGGRSCVVLGDNGTGKSSIADAVEWYFTGQIDLLTKEGRGSAIRHSGAAADLDTKVTVSTDGALGGTITVSARSRKTVRDAGRSELFLLRGRTLAEFIDKTKGEKWQALSELLGFDAIDRMRLDLQRATNELESRAQSAQRDVNQKQSALRSSASVVSEPGILETIRQMCSAAEVPPPDTLDEALRPEWVQRIVPDGSQAQRAAALEVAITQLRTDSEASQPVDPLIEWNRFVSDGEKDQRPLRLYRAADALLKSGYASDDQCPLCGRPITLDELAVRVAGELHGLQSAAEALDTARKAARRFMGSLGDSHSSRADVSRRAREQGVELDNLPSRIDVGFAQRVDAVEEMEDTTAQQYLNDLSGWDKEALASLESQIPPPSTESGQVLVKLGGLVAEARAWRLAVAHHSEASAAFDLANRAFASYGARQLRYVDESVTAISGRVAEIYQFLHPEGGIGAVTIETVGEKGAELAVEFHGHKELPPHRVLSESHLNSLGIALFLAMAETFNESLGFLVLDDVVNSFDREHRGRLAELLVRDFDDTQLVVLTHDELFFRQLSTRAPSWTKTEFTSWSYEGGPLTRNPGSDRSLAAALEALDEADGHRRRPEGPTCA